MLALIHKSPITDLAACYLWYVYKDHFWMHSATHTSWPCVFGCGMMTTFTITQVTFSDLVLCSRLQLLIRITPNVCELLNSAVTFTFGLWQDMYTYKWVIKWHSVWSHYMSNSAITSTFDSIQVDQVYNYVQ